MRTTKRYTVPQRRKREGRTHYKRRMRLLLSGEHRLVVRRSLRSTSVSIVDYSDKGDKIVAGSSVQELRKLGWNFGQGNLPGAYLMGLLVGLKAKKNGISRAVLDLGLQRPLNKSRIYAAVKGVIDAGVEVPHDGKILPDEERVKGGHIEAYAKDLKTKSQESYQRQFSAYLKQGADPSQMTSQFEQTKSKITGGQ